MPGADADTCCTYATRADADAIRATFGAGHRLVIIGGGWIGLEVAAAARGAGTDVTILEMAELPLLGVLGPEIATVFADLHREHGVDSASAPSSPRSPSTAVGRPGPARRRHDDRGRRRRRRRRRQPDVALAEAAGLDVDNGVLVDALAPHQRPGHLRRRRHRQPRPPALARRVRVEHWATALNQPATAAAAMLGGRRRVYTELPYFFSDQYDLGMEYVGYAPRASTRGSSSAATWRPRVRGVLAGRRRPHPGRMNVNVWDVIDEVKPLIADGTVVDPARLADPDVAYGELAAGRG